MKVKGNSVEAENITLDEQAPELKMEEISLDEK